MTAEKVRLPKNYREDSVLEFGLVGKVKRRTTTLMFMLNPEPHEHFTPTTIYIPGNIRRNEWLREIMYFNDEEFMLDVVSLVSHESVHLALSRSVSPKASDRLDPTFGIAAMDTFGDTHGLLNFGINFRPRRHKLKWSGKKGR